MAEMPERTQRAFNRIVGTLNRLRFGAGDAQVAAIDEARRTLSETLVSVPDLEPEAMEQFVVRDIDESTVSLLDLRDRLIKKFDDEEVTP